MCTIYYKNINATDAVPLGVHAACMLGTYIMIS